MRPVGALIFGMWADRVGRRIPLIVDVLFYSIVGFLCAFAPNFTVLIVLRLLYGIGMGGEWGLGAALAMEKIPRERRGFFSGAAAAGLLVRLPAGRGRRTCSSRRARPVLALAVRALDPARADLPAHPDPRARSPRCGRRAASR